MKIIAPAKLNLFLHITDRRQDHFHLLESLFVFTDFGDSIAITPYKKLRITFDGPYHHALSTEPISHNLVVRAAKLLIEKYSIHSGALIKVTKNIPIGAGLGGGSSNAAATLIGLNRLWKLNLNITTLASLALSLGADVPACLYRQPLFASGIGEIIQPVAFPFKTSCILLIKPNISLSTPTVFAQFQKIHASYSAKIPQENIPMNWSDFLCFLNNATNDLELPAVTLLPLIQTLLTTLKTKTDCLLSRMSGSGSACFALYENEIKAKKALDIMQKLFPGFWIILTKIHWNDIHFIA